MHPGEGAGAGCAGNEDCLGEARCLLVADTPHPATVAVTLRHPQSTFLVPGLCCRGTLLSVTPEDKAPTPKVVSSSTDRSGMLAGPPETYRAGRLPAQVESESGKGRGEGAPLQGRFPAACFSFLPQIIPKCQGVL